MKRRQFLQTSLMMTLAGLVAGSSGGTALAADESASGGEGSGASNEARFRNLSPEQKEKLREAYKTFKNLPPEKQARVREAYAKFRDLPSEQKNKVRGNLQKWRALSPEKKDRLRQKFKRWKSLSPEKREQLRSRWRARRQNSAGTEAHTRRERRRR